MLGNDYSAVPRGKGWTVRRRGSKRATCAGLDRASAWQEAQRRAKRLGGRAWLYNVHGRVERRAHFS